MILIAFFMLSALVLGIFLRSANIFAEGRVEAFYNNYINELHLYNVNNSTLHFANGGSITIPRNVVLKDCEYLGEL